MASSATMPAAYAARLRSSPGDPLLTFYDLASGERVELSATTWINWAAKVAGLLTDELDLERGSRMRVDLGTHWQASVLAGGAWWAGIAVVAPDAADAAQVDLVVCAESDVQQHLALGVPVLASSLKPMAGPCGPLPAGALDFSREVLAMPDAYVPLDAPEADDVAWLGAIEGELDQAALLAHPDDDRVLSDAPPVSAEGVALLGSVLAGSGSIVLVNRHGREVPASLPEQERVSR